MKGWELDVELRVRKTLHLAGPPDEAAARTVIKTWLSDGNSIEAFQKRTLGGTGYPVPVETIIDNDPQIVAVREVPA